MPNYPGPRTDWGLGVNAQSLLVQQPLCVHFSHYVTKPILGCLFV